jgi:hypothetical protein
MGVCDVQGALRGSFPLRSMPGDCHASICDGEGGELRVVDPDNLPLFKQACAQASCSADGAASIIPFAEGADCDVNGGRFCDGSGNCVACLVDGDCAPGETCVDHACTGDSCSDDFKDGDETDIDCGGSCPDCALTRDCKSDLDCKSGSCDALVPHRCLAQHCEDHHKNADETDADCGGSCVQCGDGRFCKADADCESGVCDQGRGGLCLSKGCLNQQLDGSETDLDCGGGICNGCALGKKCFLSYDCASVACDADTLTCIADHCQDHHFDGDETDKDCGGPKCQRCVPGQRCLVDGDCQPGHGCNPGNPHVCL